MKKIYLILIFITLGFGTKAQLAVFDMANQGANIKQNFTQGQQLAKTVENVKTAKDAYTVAKQAKELADATNKTIQETRALERSISGFSGLKISNFKTVFNMTTQMLDEYYGYLDNESPKTREAITNLLNNRTGNSINLYNSIINPSKNKNQSAPDNSLEVKNGVDNFTGVGYLNTAQFYQKLAKQIEDNAGDLSSKLNTSNTIIASPAERIELMNKCYEMTALAAELRSKSNDLIRKGTTPTPEQISFKREQNRKARNKYFTSLK